MKVKKYNGDVVEFERSKIEDSIRRTGVQDEVAKDVALAVEKKLLPNMATKDVYTLVRKELARRTPWAAARYSLREALIRMGPAGFNFERYVAAVLKAYGYKARTPQRDLKGACIPHEIDVIAEKEGRTAFIEAKFRRDFNASITIKDTLATWARYLDLVDGSRIGLCPHFDEAWIVTNARFTDQSLQYGHCKNMVLIGWNHPKERTFAQMVDLSSLYPITMLTSVTTDEMNAFAKAGFLLCRELCEADPAKVKEKTGISLSRLKELVPQCELIVYADKPVDKRRKAR